jgi:hypothetical protein
MSKVCIEKREGRYFDSLDIFMSCIFVFMVLALYDVKYMLCFQKKWDGKFAFVKSPTT